MKNKKMIILISELCKIQQQRDDFFLSLKNIECNKGNTVANGNRDKYNGSNGSTSAQLMVNI